MSPLVLRRRYHEEPIPAECADPEFPADLDCDCPVAEFRCIGTIQNFGDLERVGMNLHDAGCSWLFQNLARDEQLSIRRPSHVIRAESKLDVVALRRVLSE